MCGFVAKACMIEVTPKTFLHLYANLSGSAVDEENLIVETEELKSKLTDLEEDKEIEDIILEEIKEGISAKVEYVWFYL